LRTKDYRRQQVHNWGFSIIERRISGHEYFSRWENKDLDELDAFLRQPDTETRFAEEFVDVVQQAREGLELVEGVVNGV
jgi:hypothetical protein